MNEIFTTPNSNFSTLSDGSIHDEEINLNYKEYRRQWMENPQKKIVRDFPIHLDIETTSRCNLKCTFCDRQLFISQKNMGDINIFLYKKIIDEGSERNLCGVKLSYRGEPLLHEKIVEMVEYAKKKNILDVFFNTNAMLLDEITASRLIDAGLNRISISIEGTDPETYEKMRRGAKFNRVLSNINKLMKLREQANVKHPKLRIQTVRLPGIDIDEYVNFWTPHCDEVAAVDYQDCTNRISGLTKENWACPQLWQRMTINWEGQIMACNNDDLSLLSMGNVRNKSIHQCWHDPMVQNARTLHQNGQSHLVEACNGCPWRTAQIQKVK